MKQVLLATLLATTCISANAKLCRATTDTGKPVFMFVADKPTKTLTGTVAKLTECKPLPTLIEGIDADKDGCFAVELSYVNRDTKVLEKYWYKNGATSSDGTTWDREQNPGCPTLP